MVETKNVYETINHAEPGVWSEWPRKVAVRTLIYFSTVPTAEYENFLGWEFRQTGDTPVL